MDFRSVLVPFDHGDNRQGIFGLLYFPRNSSFSAFAEAIEERNTSLRGVGRDCVDQVQALRIIALGDASLVKKW